MFDRTPDLFSEKHGNLMDFTEDAMGHGANCRQRMGAGVAKAVVQCYPEMYEADLASTMTPEERLGTFTVTRLANGKAGYNIYSQLDFGTHKQQVDYKALRTGVELVAEDMKRRGLKSLALPKIGCGLAGGDWQVVRDILKLVAKETGIRIVVYSID